jgi:hypothetical protein
MSFEGGDMEKMDNVPLHNEGVVYGEVVWPGVAPYDALIIRDDEPDTVVLNEQMSPLDEMSPDTQVAWLLETALTYTTIGTDENRLDARVQASKLVSAGSDLVTTVYEEVSQMYARSPTRATLLAQLSLRDGMDDAWAEAFTAAQIIGCDGELLEHAHLLEAIIEGQTDQHRINDVIRAADNEDPYTQARILLSVVKQQIKNGMIDDAFNTAERIDAHVDSGDYHAETIVHLTDASVRENPSSVVNLWQIVKTLPNEHMQTWARIKIGKYETKYKEMVRLAADKALPEQWYMFTTGQRVAIVHDFIESGQTDRAAHWAGFIADPAYKAHTDLLMQTDTLGIVARIQAEGDVDDGLMTLAVARDATRTKLNELTGTHHTLLPGSYKMEGSNLRRDATRALKCLTN